MSDSSAPMRIALFLGAALAMQGCAGMSRGTPELSALPAPERYCLDAQRVVTRTDVPVELVVHEDFDAFVKSKAIIDGPEGPQIQQFFWYDAAGEPAGVSCKMKSADHLNLEFGEGSAGPDGLCQDMNRAVYRLVAAEVEAPVFSDVVFDANETVSNEEQPGMTGPDWLRPFTMTYARGSTLHIATKGFIVDFLDPRYRKAPPRFRGTHYCHLVMPGHLRALLRGDTTPGLVVGRAVDTSGPDPTGTLGR